MKKYIVEVREIWKASYLVEANSEDEARQKCAEDGWKQYYGTDYSETLDSVKEFDVTEVVEKDGKLISLTEQ